jgi:hypothetical protein
MDGSLRNRPPFCCEEDRLNPWVTWRGKCGFLVERQSLRRADVNRRQSRLLELGLTDRKGGLIQLQILSFQTESLRKSHTSCRQQAKQRHVGERA